MTWTKPSTLHSSQHFNPKSKVELGWGTLPQHHARSGTSPGDGEGANALTQCCFFTFLPDVFLCDGMKAVPESAWRQDAHNLSGKMPWIFAFSYKHSFC